MQKEVQLDFWRITCILSPPTLHPLPHRESELCTGNPRKAGFMRNTHFQWISVRSDIFADTNTLEPMLLNKLFASHKVGAFNNLKKGCCGRKKQHYLHSYSPSRCYINGTQSIWTKGFRCLCSLGRLLFFPPFNAYVT